MLFLEEQHSIRQHLLKNEHLQRDKYINISTRKSVVIFIPIEELTYQDQEQERNHELLDQALFVTRRCIFYVCFLRKDIREFKESQAGQFQW